MRMTYLLAGAMLTFGCGPSNAQGEQKVRTEVVEERIGGGVSIPPEIAPALLPYLLCRQSERGIPVYDMEGNRLDAPQAANCAAVRQQAESDAMRILERRDPTMSDAAREDFVEETLSDIDDFASDLKEVPSVIEPNRSAEAK